MIKTMVRIEFYSLRWNGNRERFHLDEGDKPNSLLIDPETIVALGDRAEVNEVLPNGCPHPSDRGTPTRMFLLQTTIGQGRGINGVDFAKFWVTEETYNKILKDFIEIA